MFDILDINIEYLKNSNKLIKRDKYYNELEKCVSIWNITIVTWMRRTWKSSLILKYLENKENIFYFSKDLDPTNTIKNNENLFELFTIFSSKNEVKYIVIDEIQDIQNWEIFVRYVFALKKYKILITGSNSKLLSWELSTFLAWRYVEIMVYPLSFKEFLWFKQKEFSQDLFKEYLIYWGLPEIINIENELLKQNYLKAIKDSVILKDIVSRYQIRDYHVFSLLVNFLADNTWNLTTWRNINNFLKNEQIKLSLSTMLDYINYWINTFIWDKVNRYDLKWKKVLEISNKYYFNDLWTRSAILSEFSTKHISQLLENFVYTELKKSWYEIFIWNYNDLEIDFVVKKQNIVKYFQVAYLLPEEKTLQRELESLKKIKDSYEKYVITLDEYKLWNYDWINVIWIKEFLEKI